jgi:PAS domain S-box-containing protein
VSVLRRDGDRLFHAAAPSLPPPYIDAVDGTPIGPATGTCGTAAFENRTVITEDVRTDERWEGLREPAGAAGIRSCWSMPIRGEEGGVLGTFAIYGGTPRTPSESARELMRKMAHVAGVALMREKQEQALRRSEERFRTVVENAQPVVFMVDRDGTFVLSEGEDLASLGLEPGEMVGESVFELYDDSELTDGIRRALNGEQFDNEIEVEGRVFDNWYSPFYDEEGAVAGCIGMAADVTERKEMEADLREREERLQVAQRIANLGYWTHDLQTGELVWSRETRRIFGWPEAKAVTYDAFMDAVHPDDRERLRAAQDAVLEEGRRLDIEYRIRRPSGEERVLQERGGLQRDEDGRPVSIMGAVLDVTERVQRRQALRNAKEAAEEADRIKAALLSNMNHELRTPLTSIISFSELVQENPDLAERFVDRILGGGRRLLYTLNTVMDFAELEGDGPTPSPEATQLEAVVRAAANGFRERARRKGIELEVDVPDAVDAVTLDEHRMERVLTHLLHNAVKFTEEGRVTVRAEEHPETAVLRVVDTGIGIESSFLPRAFDEFAQASTGYDRSHEGNGLGLTVAKRLVEQMGGTIEVESEPGEGTCVTVRVPKAPPDAGGD